MRVDRTTHKTRVEMNIQEALKTIQMLTSAVMHANNYKSDNFELCTINVVGNQSTPGTIIYTVTK